jgi:hypothetical protein
MYWALAGANERIAKVKTSKTRARKDLEEDNIGVAPPERSMPRGWPMKARQGNYLESFQNSILVPIFPQCQELS